MDFNELSIIKLKYIIDSRRNVTMEILNSYEVINERI